VGDNLLSGHTSETQSPTDKKTINLNPSTQKSYHGSTLSAWLEFMVRSETSNFHFEGSSSWLVRTIFRDTHGKTRQHQPFIRELTKLGGVVTCQFWSRLLVVKKNGPVQASKREGQSGAAIDDQELA
jgi:hypothetical protein